MVDSGTGNVYVRLSLVRPRAGQEDLVANILNDLLNFYSSQPGYIEGYSLSSNDPGPEVGRLTLWRAEHDAEATASAQHVMSRRSELMRVIEGGSQIERSFIAHRWPATEAAT
jgi:heme-degrading monooxygenase HmoA